MVANLFTIGRSRPHITKGDIPVIAREAAGLVPVSNPDDTGRTAVRDCFKQIINTNQTYMAKVNAITFEDLYTPKSYLNRDTAKRVLSQIETAMEVEGGQESGLDAILSYCEARINALDWPKGEKKNFIEGFEEKFRQTAEERVPTVTSEQQWLASLRDIYLYSLENSRYFRADGRQVRISNLQVLAEFNSRIEQANQLRDRYLAAKSEFELRQKTYFDQFGMSKADFGLKH